MNKNKVAKLVFGFLFISISMYSLLKYLDFDKIIEKEESIVYLYKEREIKRGGRSSSYIVSVYYNNKVYDVNITSKVYNKIGEGLMPKLFYSANYDIVFSFCDIKSSFRMFLVFFIGAIIAFTPFNRLLSFFQYKFSKRKL